MISVHSLMDELNNIVMEEPGFGKIAAELTAKARSKLPRSDFAVSAKKSNTGEKAYPIPDRQHASSALGFAKMHGDSADLERVRAKIKAKYPDMIKEKGSAFMPGTSTLPGMVGGPPGGMGMTPGARTT